MTPEQIRALAIECGALNWKYDDLLFSQYKLAAYTAAVEAIERDKYINAAEYFEKNPMQFQGTMANYFRSLK